MRKQRKPNKIKGSFILYKRWLYWVTAKNIKYTEEINTAVKKILNCDYL